MIEYLTYSEAAEIFGEAFVAMAIKANIKFRKHHCTCWR